MKLKTCQQNKLNTAVKNKTRTTLIITKANVQDEELPH